MEDKEKQGETPEDAPESVLDVQRRERDEQDQQTEEQQKEDE
jgi:hypothetical protein